MGQNRRLSICLTFHCPRRPKTFHTGDETTRHEKRSCKQVASPGVARMLHLTVVVRIDVTNHIIAMLHVLDISYLSCLVAGAKIEGDAPVAALLSRGALKGEV